MQFISGVNAFSYWGVALVWDLLTFIVTSLITLATLFVFQEPGWTTVQEFGEFLNAIKTRRFGTVSIFQGVVSSYLCVWDGLLCLFCTLHQ
jgi:hypothetical protein